MSLKNVSEEFRRLKLAEMEKYREQLAKTQEQLRLMGQLKDIATVFGEMAAALLPFSETRCNHEFDSACIYCRARSAYASAAMVITGRNEK
jgi:hypothetical protein